MVIIRLARGGSKHRPFHRIVVTDSRNPRDGRNIKTLGYYNPIAKGKEKSLEIKMELVSHWVSQGSKISKSVEKLLKKVKKKANNTENPTDQAAAT